MKISKFHLLTVGALLPACSASDGADTTDNAPLAAEDVGETQQDLTTTQAIAAFLTGQLQSLVTGTGFGNPIKNLSAADVARFDAGKDAFIEEEGVADGLGPVFNDKACGNCHDSAATGGAGVTVETRFGKLTNGAFDALTQFGGSLIQTTGIGTVTANGKTCTFVGEKVPSAATIVAGRLTTPLFGLGLIDAVPDSTFQSLAQSEAQNSPSTAGKTNMVANVITGRTVVGKFGWKAQVPSVPQFSGDAYVNEMGITSTFFPNENCPGGNCSLLACDPVKDPEDTDGDVAFFTDFMNFLGPPPVGAITSDVQQGALTFASIGCANCHFPALQTGANSNPALNKVNFLPFSDFLVHDMGSLGDGIPQGTAKGTEMRTAPLWGAKGRTRFLHDGRATNVTDAIKAHAGQGKAARDQFVALSTTKQAQLIALIKAL